jgi:hypothetical protein
MDDLAVRMRAAAESPPPTRIDLDALIAGELRRRRRLHVACGTAVAVAVTALMIAVPTLVLSQGASDNTYLPGAPPAPTVTGSSVGGDSVPLCAPLTISPDGPRPTQSYDTVRPRPTEPVEQAVPRLTAAGRAALREVLPAGMTVEALEYQPDCAEPQFQYDPSGREYLFGARLIHRQSSVVVGIWVAPTGADKIHCPSSTNPDDCVRTEYPDGTIVLSEREPVRKGRYQVVVYRPDGVAVLLIAENRGREDTTSGSEPPLTVEQLVQIGRAPGLTLYP